MKKFRCFVLVLALSLALCGCGASVSVNKVLKAVDSGEYQKAMQFYEERIEGNYEAEVQVHDALLALLQENYDGYNSGTQSLEDSVRLLEVVNKSQLLDPITITSAIHDLKQLQLSKEAFAEAQKYQASGDYQSAYSSYLCVEQEDSNYETAQAEAKICSDSLIQAILEEAHSHSQNSRYREAYEILEKNAAARPEAAALQDALESTLKNWITFCQDTALEAILAGEYRRGYDYLLEQQTYMPQGCELEGAASQLRQQWEEDILQQAQAAFDQGKDYEAAIALIQSADLPRDALAEELASFQSYAPIPLTSLDYSQKKPFIQVGARKADAQDVNKTAYEAGNVIHPTGGDLKTDYSKSEEDSYVTYYLGGMYSTLKGVLFRPLRSLDSETDWDDPTTVKIFGDGVLLYEGPNFTKDTYDAVPFTVDITGVRELKIIMRGHWVSDGGSFGLYGRYPKVCAGDLMIQK